jgi:5-methylcytosine-specific restriction endonuclease McrA
MLKESARVKAWREKNKKPCPSCGKTAIFKESNSCRACAHGNRMGAFKESTLESMEASLAVRGKHPSWLHVQVRNSARTQHKDLTRGACACCGYSKHVEICHVKPISRHSKQATLGEINDRTNVVALCRNCHWEFDTGLITTEQLKGQH